MKLELSFLQINQKFKDESHILRIKIEAKEETQGIGAVVTCQREIGKKSPIIQILFLQRDSTTTVSFPLDNPSKQKIESKEEARQLSKEGFENMIGLQPNLFPQMIATCQGLTKESDISQHEDTSKKKLEAIIQECLERNIAWPLLKKEFKPLNKVKSWPNGWIKNWLQYLSQIRILQADPKDLAHIEEMTHSWYFIPSGEENRPLSEKSTLCITKEDPRGILRIKNLITKTALTYRPEELLDFLWAHPKFQKKLQKEKNPLSTFLNEWRKEIALFKGELIPKLTDE